MIKELGKTIVAGMLAGSLAMPLPAAEPAAIKTAKSSVKSASRKRLAPSRYRGYAPTYADSISADDPTYDDPIVRQAVVDALGRYNGSVVAVDPNTGRILAVVNQKIAFSDGYIPCSTIKPTIAVAALEENVITRDTMLKVGRRKYMNLTEALAHSNNTFFLKNSAAAWASTRFPATGACSDSANWPATICRTNIRELSRRRHRRLAAWGACRVSVKESR